MERCAGAPGVRGDPARRVVNGGRREQLYARRAEITFDAGARLVRDRSAQWQYPGNQPLTHLVVRDLLSRGTTTVSRARRQWCRTDLRITARHDVHGCDQQRDAASVHARTLLLACRTR